MSEENVPQYKEREQTNHCIDELLDERTQVWSLYCSVAGVEPYHSDKAIEVQMQEFCQVLVDYISLGHFGIYQRIIDGSERRQSIVETAERIYPEIAKATEAVLNFNERYQDSITPAMILHNLEDDLSTLGVQLAMRIELEDELIRVIRA